MVNNCQSVCIKCGKQRVFVKTKKERVNLTWVYTATTVCPDPDCQKIVDAMLDKEQLARNKINEDHARDKILREKRMRRRHGRRARAGNK